MSRASIQVGVAQLAVVAAMRIFEDDQHFARVRMAELDETDEEWNELDSKVVLLDDRIAAASSILDGLNQLVEELEGER